MPKIKTHKATAKRFKVTGTGKLLHHKMGRSHLRRNKSKRNKRGFSRMITVDNFERSKKINQLAPTLGG